MESILVNLKKEQIAWFREHGYNISSILRIITNNYINTMERMYREKEGIDNEQRINSKVL